TSTPSAASTQAVAIRPSANSPSSSTTDPTTKMLGSACSYTSSGSRRRSAGFAGVTAHVRSAAVFFFSSAGGRHFFAAASLPSFSVNLSRTALSSTYHGAGRAAGLSAASAGPADETASTSGTRRRMGSVLEGR